MYSAKSDIHSLGIIFWEIIHRTQFGSYEQPYLEYGLQKTVALLLAVIGGQRPSMSDLPEGLIKLYRSCVAPNQDERPTAVQVLEQLKSLAQDFQADRHAWNVCLKNVPEYISLDELNLPK
jgi:hypothetical protein